LDSTGFDSIRVWPTALLLPLSLSAQKGARAILAIVIDEIAELVSNVSGKSSVRLLI
jgi:hypothetical protein